MSFHGCKSRWVGGLGIDGDRVMRQLLKGVVSPREDAPAPLDMADLAKRDALVTRKQAAEYLGVSTKTIQRMEADGVLKRCPGLLGVVRYRARDVLRLASAPGKER